MATTEQKSNSSSQHSRPCVSHHLKAGAKAGLDDERLHETIASATDDVEPGPDSGDGCRCGPHQKIEIAPAAAATAGCRKEE